MKLSERMKNPLGEGDWSPPSAVEAFWLDKIAGWADEVAQLEAENERLLQEKELMWQFIDVVRKNDYWLQWCRLRDSLLEGKE